MKVEQLIKRVKILNVINLIIVIFLNITSILGTYLAYKEGIDVDFYIAGIISITMSFLCLLIGLVLPTRWNFLCFLIISGIISVLLMTNVYLCYFEKKLCVSLVYGIEVGLWILILPFCWFWTYYNSCIEEIEKYGEDYDKLGKKIKRQSIGGSIIFFVLIGVSMIVGYIKTPENPYIPDLSKAKEFEQSLKKGSEDFTNKEAPASQTFETLEDALGNIQNGYGNKKLYYCIQHAQQNLIYVAWWGDESEDVYVDVFEKMKNGTFVHINSFQSSAMTKSKIQEEATGVLESKESF